MSSATVGASQQRQALRQTEHLFQMLLHKAFRGELGASDAMAVQGQMGRWCRWSWDWSDVGYVFYVSAI